MKIKLVSLVLFSIAGFSESIILKPEFEEFKATLKSSFSTLVQKINKKASTKSVESEILNINKETENLRNETNSDVAKLNSVITELQKTISKLEEKVNSQVQRLDSNVGELKENFDDLEQDFSKLNARSRSQISQLYSSIDDLEEGLSFASTCTFSKYKTDSDDVVVAQHAETYSGLTEVPYHFVASIAGAAFLNKYTRDHAHYYGFREFKAHYIIFCTSDNKHITTNKDEYIFNSNVDGSYTFNIPYLYFRPKICGTSDEKRSVCEQDWSLVFNKPGAYEKNCADTFYPKYGLFVKTHLYNKIAATCDLTAVR